MSKIAKTLGAGIIAVFVSACSAGEPEFDRAAHETEVLEWRAERVARLKKPDGYLTLAGLFWLTSGDSTIGSAPDNDIVLPAKAPGGLGVLSTDDNGVTFTAADDVDIRHGDIPVASIFIADDTTEDPVGLTQASFLLTVINRDGNFALRLRDFEHPAVASFPEIDYYPIDPEFRVTATLHAYDEPRVANVGTVIEGLGYHPQSPGTVVFEIDGTRHELEAYESGDELFFVFGDQTTGRETYPAGRFLYADVPGEDGRTILDFNHSYNPPCAFNDFSTCPVASPRNRLAVRIEAGEKFDESTYAGLGEYH